MAKGPKTSRGWVRKYLDARMDGSQEEQGEALKGLNAFIEAELQRIARMPLEDSMWPFESLVGPLDRVAASLMRQQFLDRLYAYRGKTKYVETPRLEEPEPQIKRG